MYTYELSEQLFLDIWNEYGSPEEITDKTKINAFLSELVKLSKGYIILDHYSSINYDNISRIEQDGEYTKIIWKDYNSIRKKYLATTLSEEEFLTWQIFGYYTYIYVLMDISKLKFIKSNNHIFILLQAKFVNPKKLEAYLLKNNELISSEVNSNELYTKYVFWEGDSQNAIKHCCIFGNLPYYSAIIQPKENCTPNSFISREIMLLQTLLEIETRLETIHAKISSTPSNDFDELFSKGNAIRRILEFALKHYCVYKEIPIEIESKYGHIELGKLKKSLKNTTISIEQKLINTANELSHDSGVQFTKDDLQNFYNDVHTIISNINATIMKDVDII